MNIFDIAKQNQEKAWQVIKNTNIIQIWEDAGAKINLVGSLRTGLLMKHRDIDFHIYSSPLNLTDSFQAMARLAENPSIKRIECANLLHTAEACIEWHAWYQNEENELWQMDMIHIREGSRYDGYFEKVAQRISEIMTDEIRETILRLKYETPNTRKTSSPKHSHTPCPQPYSTTNTATSSPPPPNDAPGSPTAPNPP